MAEYNVDDIFYSDGNAVFNEADVYSGIDETTALKAEINDELENYVKKTGSVMNGALITPNIELTNMTSQLKFSDESIQNTALSEEILATIDSIETNTQYITKSGEDETTISGSVKIAKIIFPETLGEQNFPYSDSEKAKTSAISYDEGLLKTSVANNLYATNLTCGNINTSHLSGTSSNLQTQVNTIQTSLANPTFASIKMSGNSSADSSFETFGQPDYNGFGHIWKMIDIQPLNIHRNFYLGSAGNSGTLGNHFVIATLRDELPDPDIIFSLSRDHAYFFGVKHPLVPVGAVQIYAGLSNNIPEGYLICDGSQVSQTTYNLLFAVIGNTYLYGRTASSSLFYLPDLRGMFIRMRGENAVFPGVEGAFNTGTYQAQSVQKHGHKYDKANDTIDVVTNASAAGIGLNINKSSVWDNDSDTMTTQYDVIDVDTTTILEDETRPHCINMNYIIKY